MDSYSDIISKRALAGVMIFNASKELIYVNEEAKKFLNALMDEGNSDGDGTSGPPTAVSEEVVSLCGDMMTLSAGEKHVEEHGEKNFIYRNVICGGEDFFLRAIPIHKITKTEHAAHVMITVEKFSTRLTADVKKVGAKFGLTKRETEVLKGVARGMTNRDISKLLFISEYTVKDHVRSIMQKIDVKSRSLLICRIFECNQ